MASCKSSPAKATAASDSTKQLLLEPATTSAAPAAPAPAPAPEPPPLPLSCPAPEPNACEADPWPLLCPTPDCNEHLRAHPHPSAPVLFAACGHSHCGLCAAVVLREPLPQCPTCGAGVGAGQASPNTGLGQYGEAVLSSCLAQLAGQQPPVAQGPQPDPSPATPVLLCAICKADDGLAEAATFGCACGSCDNTLLCCDHSRFHAKKTGHSPVGLAANVVQTGNGPCGCLGTLPISHYCMLHSELLCSNCVSTRRCYPTCASEAPFIMTLQEAADHFAPALSSTATAFTVSAADMLRGIAAVTTAKTAMISRFKSSISQYSESIDAVIVALDAHRSHVIAAANQQCVEYSKTLDSQAEVMAVSANQLQAAVVIVAGAISSCSPARILEAHATVQSMAALVGNQYAGPVVVPVVEVRCDYDPLLSKLEGLSKVVTGTGLTVTSVSGLELQPGSQQELRVALSLEDGSSPSWLLDSDLECTVECAKAGGLSAAAPDRGGDAVVDAACDARASLLRVETTFASLRVLSQRVGPGGEVVVAYELLGSDVQEVGVQLSVCGVKLGPATGWRASRCRQSPLTCTAMGAHVRTLPVETGLRFGLAVSADEKWLVVGRYDACTLSVYSLPDGNLVRMFGGSGSGPLQFKFLFRLCLVQNGNVLAADFGNRRLQEVTLEGVFVRFIGEGVWSSEVGWPWSVAAWNDVIAVGSGGGTGPRLTMLGYASGTMTSRFGDVGTAPGQLSVYCGGICFTADGTHVIVAESVARRLSLFAVSGAFVQCIGAGVISGSDNDVCTVAKGEYVVADTLNHRVCVFSADGSELVRTWGLQGLGNGQFQKPTALASVGARVYVLDSGSPRVQVFE